MPYDPAVEAAAFRRLHTLSQALAQLKEQGNTYGVAQLLPYYRQALDAYRAAGASDPDTLTAGERFYLELGNLVQQGIGTVGRGVQAVGSAVRMPLMLSLVVAGLVVLWLLRERAR